MNMMNTFNNWMAEFGASWLGLDSSSFLYPSTRACLLLLSVLFAHMVIAKLIIPGLRKLISHIRLPMLGYFLKHNVFLNILRMIPVGLMGYFSYLIGNDIIEDLVGKLTSLTFIVNGILFAYSLIDAIYDHLEHRQVTRRAPVKPIVQFIKMAILCVAVIFAASVIMDKSPTILLSGLGAISAILLITFRDPIYQLSCGISVTSQRLCSIGDWISLPAQKVDGEVVSMGMTTCVVEQWDRSLISVNMSDLLSGMMNWQNIYAKGRRIKRDFLIDIDSIKFLSQQDIDALRSVTLLGPHFDTKLRENVSTCDDEQGNLLNERRLTNIGVFRAYVEAYLKQHHQVDHNSTLLVRLLESTDKGVPLQIYCYGHGKNSGWAVHESISSDIADWIFAAIKTFDLRLYQHPSQFAVEKAFK